MSTKPKAKAKRGFACLTPERRKEIAAMGGAAVPDDKRSFSINRALAADAGQKGGLRSRGGGRKPGTPE